MKNLKPLLLFLLILMASLQMLHAQNIRSFSTNPAIFITELETYMGSTNKTDGETAYKLFKKVWESNAYNEVQTERIIDMCNDMIIALQAPVPNFSNFLYALSYGKDTNVSAEKFDNWLKASQNFLATNQKAFERLTIFSINFFRESALAKSSSANWYANANDFQFIFNRGEILVRFNQATLYGVSKDDSIKIYETSGSFNIDQNLWTGAKGKSGWERQGLPIEEMNVQFKHYQIDMKQVAFKADTVLLYFPALSSDLIEGRYEDRASQSALSSNKTDFSDAPFPSFSSFKKDLTFSAIASGKVKFKGGLGLSGSKMRATGNANEQAVLEFYYKEKKMIEALTENFSIGDKAIRSQSAEITIYTDSGTIYHPSMMLNFLGSKNTLTLSRGSKGLEQAPIYNSDHMLEIYVDKIVWNMDEPKIDFDMSQDDATAHFESANYFKDFRYEKIQGILGYHPLGKLQQYCIKNRTREFSLDDYTQYMRGTKSNIKIQIIQLADQGFLYFDPQTEKIRVKPKVFHYVNAHFKMTDYDVLRFNSVIGARPNAYLNLVNNDFVIEGVPAFRFSDSQTVTAHPHEQTITVKHGRNLKFGGLVRAGRFDFGAKEWAFSYSDFSISSDHINYMKIYYPDPNNQSVLLPIKSVLRDINGTLLIDKQTNKSGLVDYPEYPIFISRSSALITYDKPEIFGGTYKKDDFRFEVDPFTIDSLDNFTIAGLKFPGTFVSAGILPEFRYEASIMEDYSLGFRKSSPPGGYPMYGGKAQGEIDIEMSEKGLWASGTLNYNGAKMNTPKMALMPDSAFAEVDLYTIEESAVYPRLVAANVFNRWKPYGDSMIVHTNEHDVDVLRDGQKFNGQLIHSSTELSGSGLFHFPGFEMTSANHRFRTNKVLANPAAVKIGAIDGSRISFSTSNVNADVNFDTRIGEFKSNIPGELTEFPYNAFASSMDEFKWNMDRETIELNKGPKLKTEQSYFVSRHPDQHGLKFISTKALFDMKAGIIYADEVPYIDVADSRVFPFEEKVVINKDADISPLNNAKIWAARENKYHELFDVNVKIMGRKALSGSGSYIYKDKHKTGQKLFFDKIVVYRDTSLVAKGYIGDSSGFILSPKIAYKGSVDLASTEEYLAFNGYVKPLHSFKSYVSSWIRYQDRPDPRFVVITTGRPRDDANNFIDVGMHMSSSDSFFIYPTFFARKPRYSDYDLSIDTGVFYYDEQEEAFKVGDKGRLIDGAIHGSYLSMNEKTMIASGHGKLNVGLGMGSTNENRFDVLTAGKAWIEDEDSVGYADLFMAITMLLPDAAYSRMAAVLQENSEGKNRIAYDEHARSAIAEFVDAKRLKKIDDRWESDRELVPQGEIDRNLVLTSGVWKTDRQRRSMILNGPVSIASVNGKYIGRQFDAKAELNTKRSGTKLNLYLEVTKFDWFYFEYFRGNLMVYSTDKEFNQAILDGMKKINKKGHIIRPASPSSVTRFVDKLD